MATNNTLDPSRWSVNLRFVISLAVHVSLGTFFVSSALNRIDRLDDTMQRLESKQDKAEAKNEARMALIEADIASLKVRVAVLEKQVEKSDPK